MGGGAYLPYEPLSTQWYVLGGKYPEKADPGQETGRVDATKQSLALFPTFFITTSDETKARVQK